MSHNVRQSLSYITLVQPSYTAPGRLIAGKAHQQSFSYVAVRCCMSVHLQEDGEHSSDSIAAGILHAIQAVDMQHDEAGREYIMLTTSKWWLKHSALSQFTMPHQMTSHRLSCMLYHTGTDTC